MLSDHYDPRHKALRLSEDVYSLSSIASVGVAAHEAGHALQDKTGYAPLQIRSIMVPAVSIGSNVGPILFMAGMFLAGTLGTTLAWAGIALFGSTALFALVTLPVEFDASRRPKSSSSHRESSHGLKCRGSMRCLMPQPSPMLPLPRRQSCSSSTFSPS